MPTKNAPNKGTDLDPRFHRHMPRTHWGFGALVSALSGWPAIFPGNHRYESVSKVVGKV